MTSRMTSKISVNNAYFCKNFVIITQLVLVRFGRICTPKPDWASVWLFH